MEDGLLVAHHHRVAGVVAALIAYDDIGVLGQYVDDFTFSFIAPLGTDNNDSRHDWASHARGCPPTLQRDQLRRHDRRQGAEFGEHGGGHRLVDMEQ